MTPDELRAIYEGYIACLNARAWDELGRFVDPAVERNGVVLGLVGYRDLLENDVRAIPDLRFEIELLVAEPPRIASRLAFDCTPRGTLFDLPVNGRRVRFAEHAIYEVSGSRIRRVWSIIDTAAIARQL